MGAIQGAVNQMLGSAAVAATAVKHIGEQKEAAKTKALEDVISVGEDLPKLKEEAEGLANTNLNLAKEEEALYELGKTQDAFKSQDDVEAYKSLRQGLDKDKEMAQVALNTVMDKIEARRQLLARSSKILGGKIEYGK